MEDRKIIQLLFWRDEAALSEISVKYGAEMHRTAQNITGSADDADEIRNDALNAVWSAIPPECPQVLSAYVLRIVRNLACKRVRERSAEKRGTPLSLDAVLEEFGDVFASSDGEPTADSLQLSGILNRFLEECSASDRIIFLRRFWYADSLSDVAAAAGMSQARVSVRLTRLKKRLRALLISEGVSL